MWRPVSSDVGARGIGPSARGTSRFVVAGLFLIVVQCNGIIGFPHSSPNDFGSDETEGSWDVVNAIGALAATSAPRLWFAERYGDRIPIFVVKDEVLTKRKLSIASCAYDADGDRVLCRASELDRLHKRAARLSQRTKTTADQMAIGEVMGILAHELGHVAQHRSVHLQEAEPSQHASKILVCEGFEQEPVEMLRLEEDADLASLRLLYESRNIEDIKPYIPGWLNVFADRAFEDLVEWRYGPDPKLTLDFATLTALLEQKFTCIAEKTHPNYARRSCTVFGVAAQMEAGGAWSEVLDRYHRTKAYLECQSIRHGVGGLLHLEDSWMPGRRLELAALLRSAGMVPNGSCPDSPGSLFSPVTHGDLQIKVDGIESPFCFPWREPAPTITTATRCEVVNGVLVGNQTTFRMDARGVRLASNRLPDEFEWSIIVGPGDSSAQVLARVVAPVCFRAPEAPGDYVLGVRFHVWDEPWSDVIPCGGSLHFE